MSEKQVGLIQKDLDKIFAEIKTAQDIGKLSALFTAEQQIKIYQLIADAKADFPFKIYFDNDIGGENSYSFYPRKNGKTEEYPIDTSISDLMRLQREIAEWLEKWFYGVQEKNGLYCVNQNIAPTPK